MTWRAVRAVGWARTKRARRPAGGAAQAQLEDVGGAGVGGLGAGRGAGAVGRVVAGGVERQPRRPRAAARARADLRLEVAAALPAQPDQVEAPRRVQHAASCASARGVGAVLVERELEQRRAGGEGGAGAERAAGDGGGAEAEGLSAVEAAADARRIRTRHSPERTVRPRTNAILHPWTNVRPPAGAVGAGAPQHDVVGFDGVAEPLGEPVDQLLELGVLERVEAPAAVADRVVVVLAAGVGGLVAGGAVDVDAADEPEPGQHVDRAVDAREPDRALLVAQPVVDRLRAQAALLAGEQVEHLLARAARAVPRAGQLALGMGLPFGLRPSVHSVARMKTRISFSKVMRRR